MTTSTRPTLRCLREDLDGGWEDSDDQQLVARNLAWMIKPVHTLAHPLIGKAVDDFPVGADADQLRESISGIASPPVYWKVKVNRWRGAVYEDADGQAWLVAGGTRTAGSRKDFYKQFMELVDTRGHGYFLPTSQDKALRARELGEDDLIEWELGLVREAVSWVQSARNSGNLISETITGPSGKALCTVSVMYGPADDDAPHEFLVEINTLNWAVPGLLEWAEQIVLASIHPCESRWGSTFLATRVHSIEVTKIEELDSICRGDLSADHPGHMEPGTTAHVVHTTRLTESIVEGDPVQGVCGQWFVPRQDHVSKPVCDVCRTIGEVFGITVAASNA